jgi:hypothetical protein
MEFILKKKSVILKNEFLKTKIKNVVYY